MTPLALRDLAAEAAVTAGRRALQHFNSPTLAVEWKSDQSPVTIADKQSEETAREIIRRALPDDGWLGEETGTEEGTTGRRWIVDPIDGTRNFIQGIPLWSTLVACEEETPNGPRIVASAVAIPALDELYDAALGHGARWNHRRIQVSTTSSIDQALWCFETRTYWEKTGIGALFDHLMKNTRLQRGIPDAYAHMLVASGRADLVIEPGLSIWDLAAPSLIVTEAGGTFTDLSGAATIRSKNALISNGRLHGQALELLEKFRG